MLAGLDSSRRLRASLPLSDVIRTAVSEIEAYDRVDLVVAEDAKLHGRSALRVAHLLAELLENATHFSDPDTRVVVSCAPGNGGIEVTVTDRGLGMGADELAAVNAAIASPSNADLAVSQRLGFSVIGRLAQRMGIPISVDPGTAPAVGAGLSFGTIVTLTLPATLFESAVTTRPARTDDLPAPVPVPLARDLAPVTVVPGDTTAVLPVAVAVPTPAAQPVSHPARAVSSAPAIDILPVAHGSRRRRRTGAPRAAAHVPPVTTPAEAEVLASFVASAPLPTRSPAQPLTGLVGTPSADLGQLAASPGGQAAALAEPEIVYAPSQPAPPTRAPLATGPVPAGALARRVRQPEGAAAEPLGALPEPIVASERTRTASDVRGMLSGFREGIERGRSTAAARPDATAAPT